MLTGCKEMADFLGMKTPEVPGEDGAGGGGNVGGETGEDGEDGTGGETGDNPLVPIDTFYVRSDGDDGKDGSEATPFATLATAYAAALGEPTVQTIVILSDLDTADEATTLNPAGQGSKVITIKSDNGQRKLTRSIGTNDAVVKVTDGANVVFSNIKIDGTSAPHRALSIDGAEVTLETGAQLVGNITGSGGGVYNGGTFEMSGNSAISGNTINSGTGGGVYNGGTFKMSGNSAISGNTINNGTGGGVYNDGAFTMEGTSKISGNKALTGSGVLGNGGGVYVAAGIFTMTSGTISSNTTVGNADLNGTENAIDGNGGGVYVESNGTFKMTSGIIYGGNDADESLRNKDGSLGTSTYSVKGDALDDNTINFYP
jgi:hypothetical protein